MAEPYQPLFNRTYLTGLVWVMLIVILWLTNLNDESRSTLLLQTTERAEISALEQAKEPLSMSLLFPVNSGFSDAAQTDRAVLAELIQQRLYPVLQSHSLSYSLSGFHDHISVQITANEESAADKIWPLLWNRLSAPLEPTEWQTLRAQQQARRYLQPKSSEELLLEAFYQQLPASKAPYHAPTSLPLPKILISGKDALEFAEDLAEIYPESSQRERVQVLTGLQPQQQQANYQGTQQLTLLGQTLAARNTAEFFAARLAATAVQLTLDQYKVQYRVRWESLVDYGYQGIILKTQDKPEELLARLSLLPDLAVVEKAKKQLQQQWQQIIDEPALLRRAAEVAHFYQLPQNALQDYEQSLNDVPVEQILSLARQSLDPNRSLVIHWSPEN